MLTAYKVNPLSAWLLRRMIATRFVSLINILMEREVIPEYLQERCTGALLGMALAELREDEAKQQAQREAYAQALAMLRSPEPDKLPSQVAAAAIVSA